MLNRTNGQRASDFIAERDHFCRSVGHVDERAIAARQSRSLRSQQSTAFINLRVYQGGLIEALRGAATILWCSPILKQSRATPKIWW